MNDGEHEQPVAQARGTPYGSCLSLFAPFAGFVVGLVVGLNAPHFQWFRWGFRVWLGFGVAGLLCGVVALARAERLCGLSLAGLLLNGVLVLWLVAWCKDLW
jgi:hypothetical protein